MAIAMPYEYVKKPSNVRNCEMAATTPESRPVLIPCVEAAVMRSTAVRCAMTNRDSGTCDHLGTVS